jgi:hypothetical protein
VATARIFSSVPSRLWAVKTLALRARERHGRLQVSRRDHALRNAIVNLLKRCRSELRWSCRTRGWASAAVTMRVLDVLGREVHSAIKGERGG